jgi:octaheme c-type cytochrome (tetrathionate reductase family)
MKVLTLLLSLLFTAYSTLAQDHSENVSGPYDSPIDVTAECLMCHEDAGEQVLSSNHWNWLSSISSAKFKPDSGNGKHIAINNFCLSVSENSNQCITCHVPSAGIDESFEFNSAENIDCLVCHDQTGTYRRSPFGSGITETDIDLLAVARSVGKPKTENCATCHFSGSGGVLMRSAAMDKSLINPSEEIDYHLGGLGFGCSDCHESEAHNISAKSESGESPVACQNCHDSNPHKKENLNNHSSAVACQTCHIPTYARTEPAITFWDWSKAGEDRDSLNNEFGQQTYFKNLGELVWSNNIKPEYYWSNGSSEYYELGEKIEKSKSVDINKPTGKISDAKSKISPFKVVKSKQPYDPVNKNLIIPRIYGEDGYSNNFNWVAASTKGMKQINREFSGTVDFIETKMYWPINHLVMSSDNALKCTSCHGKGGEGLLNWKELGYPDDPMKKGGRVKNKLIKE